MKTELILPDTQIVASELPAVPRDSSKNDWLRLATTVFGALGVSALSQNARAQDAPAAMPDATAPAMGTAAPDATAPMTGTMPATGGAEGSQAVVTNSIVPTLSNPNNPQLTIPASGKKATPSDVAILNFALGLEYLEADFYARVVAAHQARPYLSPASYNAAQKLAADEAAHVAAILEILTLRGATPVAKPAFKFPAAAFISNVAFLDTATELEETGVGAYSGAAPMVQAKDVLKFAASVYGIETRHAGLIRHLAGRTIAPNDVEIPLSMDEVLKRVQPMIA